MHIKTDSNNIVIGIYGRDQGDSTFTDKEVKVGQTFSGGNVSGISPDSIREKEKELSEIYKAKLDEGAVYSSKAYNCNSDHIYALSAKIDAAVYPFDWPVIDYSEVVSIADNTEAISLKSALYLRAEAVKNVNYTVKLPAIKTATTEAELDAVNLSTGWPA